MFHSRVLVLVFVLSLYVARTTWADENTYSGISVSYHSWVEKMTLDRNDLSDYTWATMAGTGIHYEQQFFWGKSGINLEAGFLFGSAAAGSNNSFSYTADKTSYSGIEGSLKIERRLNPQVSFAAGPMLLYRSLKWSTTDASLKVASGSDVNTGLIGQMTIRLNPQWDLLQEIGALAYNATTYWQLGIGMKF